MDLIRKLQNICKTDRNNSRNRQIDTCIEKFQHFSISN